MTLRPERAGNTPFSGKIRVFSDQTMRGVVSKSLAMAVKERSFSRRTFSTTSNATPGRKGICTP